MNLAIRDVSQTVAALQAARYRAMSPSEKMACADALFALAWDAVRAGVRMRQPTLDAVSVDRAARVLLSRASD
jgi:hypothetical protein